MSNINETGFTKLGVLPNGISVDISYELQGEATGKFVRKEYHFKAHLFNADRTLNSVITADVEARTELAARRAFLALVQNLSQNDEDFSQKDDFTATVNFDGTDVRVHLNMKRAVDVTLAHAINEESDKMTDAVLGGDTATENRYIELLQQKQRELEALLLKIEQRRGSGGLKDADDPVWLDIDSARLKASCPNKKRLSTHPLSNYMQLGDSFTGAVNNQKDQINVKIAAWQARNGADSVSGAIQDLGAANSGGGQIPEAALAQFDAQVNRVVNAEQNMIKDFKKLLEEADWLLSKQAHFLQ